MCELLIFKLDLRASNPDGVGTRMGAKKLIIFAQMRYARLLTPVPRVLRVDIRFYIVKIMC
jgi:hypothetical protein